MSSSFSIQVTLAGGVFEIAPRAAHQLAIALRFEASESAEKASAEKASAEKAAEKPPAQPNAFGLPGAHAAPARAGDFVGATRLGGSANCATIQLNPHGNGTHTECVGHLVDEPVSVGELAAQALIPALILSVPIERLGDVAESYDGASRPKDRVVTKKALQTAWEGLKEDTSFVGADFSQAIILRTQPNDEAKKTRQYAGSNPPYPTADAVRWLDELGCQHLVVDLPSLDREIDHSRLPNHHIFFELSPGAHSLQGRAPSPKTVTEMAFIPDTLADGPGFLSLQLPRFALDAAPSRPLFFEIISPK